MPPPGTPDGVAALRPPIAPMLAVLARELPVGPRWSYEPKWDGFRCLPFVAGGDLRAPRAPTVSMPVTWESVGAGAAGDTSGLFFSPAATLARLDAVADRFAPVLHSPQELVHK